MSEPERLSAPAGLLLDRSAPIAFRFEGERYTGLAGDTIASALAAHGVRTLSRSFKYHRPRGILTMAGQDANTLVQLPHEPNVLADREPIREGLEVRGQNYAGSLALDRRAVLDGLGRFLPVGFYYKAFYKPRGAWRRWEPLIRAYAGLGAIDRAAPHGYYDKAYAFCDVAVVGGGPAGLAAALTAAAAGAEVTLIDENPALGGALCHGRFDTMGARAAALRKELLAGLAAASDVVHMTGAVANGLYDDGWLAVIRGNRLYKVRAKAVVVATGAMEQPAVFRNNDRPGVMLGTAAQRLIRLYGVRPGRRAVVLAGNDDAYGVALDLAAAGVEVAAVIDLNGLGRGALAEGARDAGLPVLAGHTVAEVIDAPGSHEVVAVRAAPLAGRGRWQGGGRTIDCDLVCMSVGYVPAAQLLSHAGADVGYDDSAATFVVGALPVGVFAAGSVAGHYDLDAVLADGRCAGWAAARHAGFAAGAEPTPPSRPNFTPNHPWPIFPHPRGREFVDFDEDLQVADLRAAVGDGFAHIELLKRYSTLGMGPSQGRHSALPGVLLTADATGTAAHGIRRTTVRPPYTAEKFGVLAGRGFEPVRVTAMHQRHLAAGAKMMPAGPWLRPAHYPSRPGDHGPTPAEAAIRGEALSVRNGVGIIDVSTLGGLDVRGPDAAEFLERMYTFAYAKQPVGRGRYVLMTDLAGVIVDDGVACRFGEHHFYVTATTSGAQAVYQEMLWYNAQWRLQVDVTNVTAAYCGVNIAGPGARRVLQRLADDIDLSPNAFPYMGVRQGTVAGVFARVLRVGFVGELGYEIHVLAPYGEALWDALMIAGATEGIRPFGVEAQRLLRLEKGHIIIGQDTDGSTHPYEADMAWAIARKKPFFVGQRSVAIQAAQPLMRKLVGFVLADRAAPVPKECHLVIRDGEITGRVTSCAHSPSLEQIIGLAYVAPDQAVAGGTFAIKVEGGRMVEARVVALPFYDPEGKRQEL